jgi:hypothetical protein
VHQLKKCFILSMVGADLTIGAASPIMPRPQGYCAAAATAASALQQPPDLFCGQFTIPKVVVHLTMLL